MSVDIADDVELYDRNWVDLRLAFSEVLRRWYPEWFESSMESTYQFMAELLGYPDYFVMMKDFNAEDARKLEILCGPHGYTYCKMLQVWETQ